jgi:hypothetical protein
LLSHLLCSVDFFHGTRNKLHRQKFADFVTDIERCVKDDVPTGGGNEELGRVLQWPEDRFTQQSAGYHAAGENNEHCAQPASQWMFSMCENASAFVNNAEIIYGQQKYLEKACAPGPRSSFTANADKSEWAMSK